MHRGMMNCQDDLEELEKAGLFERPVLAKIAYKNLLDARNAITGHRDLLLDALEIEKQRVASLEEKVLDLQNQMSTIKTEVEKKIQNLALYGAPSDSDGYVEISRQYPPWNRNQTNRNSYRVYEELSADDDQSSQCEADVEDGGSSDSSDPIISRALPPTPASMTTPTTACRLKPSENEYPERGLGNSCLSQVSDFSSNGRATIARTNYFSDTHRHPGDDVTVTSEVNGPSSFSSIYSSESISRRAQIFSSEHRTKPKQKSGNLLSRFKRKEKKTKDRNTTNATHTTRGTAENNLSQTEEYENWC